MQINSINNYNQNITCKKPSFKSVIPVKVFIDDLPSTDEKNINRGILRLYNIIFKPAKNKFDSEIKTKFVQFIKDFKEPSGSDVKKRCLTSSNDNGKFYLFTGPEAEKLGDLSDEIGWAQREGLIKHDTSKTYEAKAKKKAYFDQIKRFINSNARIRERFNTETRAYEGNEIGLCIFTKSKGTPGKKNFKLVLDKIVFRKIQNAPKEIPSEKSGSGQFYLFK